MSKILEAPETVHEEAWRDSSEAAQAVSLGEPASRRGFWRLLAAYVTGLVPGGRQRSKQRQDVIVDSRQPELQYVDRLAREYPHLYFHIIAG